ncbi:FAD-dependent oxidoreductase [Sphingomonas sp. BK235]|uniref:FAD-dependent oxidoreductase n=1 Tax=Sphingomonas sp. BK235 TaxID=2512131 RepID=UPI00105046BE|nr:FAD-dependent oxidoreductase [Sphingomonas sp. BK235]TCP31013.1 monomeric sarcosine oxidase [Sphingomonas sp. BK235]
MPALDVSRRGFLAGAAAAPAAASLAAPAQRRGGEGEGGGWDAIIVGAGVFGAWTAWQLQASGARVLLVDAWAPAHAQSSSGGETRLIRTEYRADPLYTRWAWESLAEWKALSARHEGSLFHETGALYIYPRGDPVIGRSVALQRSLGIPIDTLSQAQLSRRWPQMNFDGIAVGVLQPTMGALMARRSVQMLVHDFVARGGSYREVAVAPPAVRGRLDAVSSRQGERLAADRFVFACGPWLPKLFPTVVGARIVPIRKEVFFFVPERGDERFAAPQMPAFVDVSSNDLHYGFPDIEARGFKVALDLSGPVIDPDTADRRVTDQGLADVRGYLRRRFPDLADRPLAEARVCQYENTDNGNLIIDRHPDAPNVWIAGGGSGHGFKHGPSLGRYLAALMAGGGKAEDRFLLASHRPHAGEGEIRQRAD